MGQISAASPEIRSEQLSDEGILLSLGIQPTLFAFQLINVGLVLAIIWFLVLRPLVARLEERKRTIDEGLDNAKRSETALMMAERRARDIVDESKVEANRVIERSTDEAVAAGERMKKKARSDIELLVNQAKRNLDIDREAMRGEIRTEAAGLVIAALQKILPEKFDKETDEGFIKDILKKVS